MKTPGTQMQWIENNKATLNALSVISAVAAAVALVVFRSREAVNFEPWQLGLAVLPWVLFTIFFLPLVHRSWFKRPQPFAILAISKVFFWLVAAGVLAVFVLIYRILVFVE